MMKWLRNLIRKICEWNIIMSKTALLTIELTKKLDGFNSMMKTGNFNPDDTNVLKRTILIEKTEWKNQKTY